MEQLTLLNGFAAVFGILLLFLDKYRKRDVQRDFNPRYWVMNNTFDLIYSVVASIGLFLIIKDMSVLVGKWMVIDPPYLLTAFLCGLLGQKLVIKLTKLIR